MLHKNIESRLVYYYHLFVFKICRERKKDQICDTEANKRSLPLGNHSYNYLYRRKTVAKIDENQFIFTFGKHIFCR